MSESDDEDGFDAFNDDTFGDRASTWEEETHEFLVAKATVDEDVEGQKQHRRHPFSNSNPFPAKIDDYVMLQEDMSQGMKLVGPPPQLPSLAPPLPHHPQGPQGTTMSLPQMNLPLIRSSPFDSLSHMHQRPPWIASQMPQQRFTPNQPPPRYRQQQHFHHHQRQYHNLYHINNQQHTHIRRRYNNSHHYHHNNNNRSYASHYNNRNRETFGDELVDAHKQTFREQNQRYYHNNRDHHHHHGGHNNSNGNQHFNNNHKSLHPPSSKVLMTPDRVYANRVLNNRRSDDSTGDPGMDMRRNVKYMMTQKENDEYSGLMIATERQWVLQIQLSQLKCENPFVDDYYYTVFNQKKNQREAVKLDASTKSNELSNNNNTSNKSNNDSQSMEKNRTPMQLKRTEEGPQLLISEYSVDDDSNTYTPVQFDNSLGKLQASSVKAPRMAIEIDASNNDLNEGSTSNAQKDSRKYKQTLLELEHLFFLTIEVEDSEKKLAALPTNTTVRNQVESERVEALVELRKRLSVETNVRRYILVKKGKTLLKRVLRHLEQTGVNCVISIIFALLPTALRRDRDDHLLPELLPQFIEHFDSSPKSYIIHYLKLLNCGQETSQGYLPTYRNNLSSSSLGVTLLLLLVERLDSSDEKESKEILKELSSALKETPIIVPPIKGYSSLWNIDSSENPGFYRTQIEKIFSLK